MKKEQRFFDLEDIEDCTGRTVKQEEEDNKANPRIYSILEKKTFYKYDPSLFPFVIITEEELAYIKCMFFEEIKKSILSQIEDINSF